MKVNVLGTSCTWFKRNNTSYIIDDKIVLDVPAGNYKLINREVDIHSLDCVIISHFHTDHFADMHIIATRIMRRAEREEKFKIYAPHGVLEKLLAFNKLMYGGPDECNAEDLTRYIEFVELEDGFEFETMGYKVKSLLMNHGQPETFGFIFTDKDGKVVSFSADTAMCDNVHKLLQSADFAFVEMSDLKPSRTHLGADEFVELSKQYKNVKMFPVHTSDRAQEFAIENGLNYLNDGDILDL